MAAVRAYVDAFNTGNAKAMAAACADPMQPDGPVFWVVSTDALVREGVGVR